MITPLPPACAAIFIATSCITLSAGSPQCPVPGLFPAAGTGLVMMSDRRCCRRCRGTRRPMGPALLQGSGRRARRSSGAQALLPRRCPGRGLIAYILPARRVRWPRPCRQSGRPHRGPHRPPAGAETTGTMNGLRCPLMIPGPVAAVAAGAHIEIRRGVRRPRHTPAYKKTAQLLSAGPPGQAG